MRYLCSIAAFSVYFLLPGVSLASDFAVQRLALSVHELSQENKFDLNKVGHLFCVNMSEIKSHRVGYVMHAGGPKCGLPIDLITTDVPVHSFSSNIFVILEIAHDACLSPSILEKMFPDGEYRTVPDSGTTFYSANTGVNVVGIGYRAATSGEDCMSDITVRMQLQ